MQNPLSSSTSGDGSLKLIGSGFGRTGTLSLKAALEILGFAPCYHMEEVLKRPSHIKLWQQIGRNQPVPWEAIFDGFQDRKSTRLNSSHTDISRMPSSA